jgi:hypothetical protein
MRAAVDRATRGNKIVLVAGAVVCALVYGLIAFGGRPGSADSVDTPSPFEVAITDDNGAGVKVDEIELFFLRDNVAPTNERSYDSKGYFSVDFLVARPTSIKLALAIAPELQPDYLSIGRSFPAGSDTKDYSIPGWKPTTKFAESDFPGIQVRDSKEWDGDVIRGVMIPLSLPAGGTRVTLSFQGDLDRFRYPESWGVFKRSFEIAYPIDSVQAAFAQLPLVSFSQRASDRAMVEISYAEGTHGCSLTAANPDPADAGARYIAWRRPVDSRDGRFLVSLEVRNARMRYWLDRVPDLLLVVLGCILGVFAERFLEKSRSAVARTRSADIG